MAPLTRPQELARIAVPAICFVLQNNILYVALSNLEPLLFQISYQIKTLLTALLSVHMFKRAFSRWQWLSQLMLTAGVVRAIGVSNYNISQLDAHPLQQLRRLSLLRPLYLVLTQSAVD